LFTYKLVNGTLHLGVTKTQSPASIGGFLGGERKFNNGCHKVENLIQ